MDPISNNYRYFLVLMDKLSISRASEKIGINQGALSRVLQKLEAQLDSRLFHRTSRGLKPTEFAENLSKKLHKLDLVWNEDLSVSGQTRGKLTLATSAGFTSRIFQNSFLAYSKKFPMVDLKWMRLSSHDISRKVANSELDIGLAFDPKPYPELIKKKIINVKAYLYLKRSNKKEVNLVFHDSNTIFNRSIIKKLKNVRLVEVEDYDLINELILKTDHASGILPDLIGEANKKLIKNGPAVLESSLYLVYRSNRVKDPLVRNMVDLVTKFGISDK